MKTVLLTFGDSWLQGVELGDGKRYGEILQKQIKLVNIS
tara:strand:- start:1533 stop:1649 length:117 start_codon:yes stop_codon:yes gene_type:complete